MNSALEKIHEFERFGSVLGLERMTVLLEKLENPQNELNVIHVAGTNGKGSICKYVYEVLRAQGYKTGLYTSPFLEVFNERIELDGQYITDEDLEVYTNKVLEKSKEMVEEGGESPTEFEVVTAIAFLYFKEKQIDYLVLEVGLGGRGDSTNVVNHPLITIIASISLDHVDRLGTTIAEIAAEKAGIIKAKCPVVIGTDRAEAKRVIEEKAAELSAPLFDASEIGYEVKNQHLGGYRFTTEVLGNQYDIEISMMGKHQIQNAITALYALIIMQQEKKISLSPTAIAHGFRKAKQIGRFELMRENPYVIIDGAHNPDGSRALRDAVKDYYSGKKILMVVGILADKDVEVLDHFMEITNDFVATQPQNPRKMNAKELGDKITKRGGNCIVLDSPKDAVDYAKTRYQDYDAVLYAGSLYLIGEIRGILKND